MIESIAAIRAQAQDFAIPDKAALEAYRLEFIARNGVINDLFAQFKLVPNDQKKAIGAALNELKQYLEARFKEAQDHLERSVSPVAAPIDLTLPVVPETLGSRHPINIIREKITRIFAQIGFAVADGPEIEDDWHNFGALNFPPNHPARDMQDTFFVQQDPAMLLRTHTSSVQVRLMEKNPMPVRAIMPGRVYRNEAISARAHCLFHQIEGIYIDKGVSFADLKQTLYYFVKELFGSDVRIRFRASYFPFTEPSAEMDISCLICKGEGCNICKYTGWVEILGSGMVHSEVIKNSGHDPEVYTGFAFGMGIERISMLLFDVKDLRLYTENDVRFLRQFSHLAH